MSTSPYFNHSQRVSEQNLVDDLIVEAIQIKGFDTYYIPRTLVKENPILGEDILNKFEERYELEMYIKDSDSFKGEGSFMKKFGLEIRDQSTVVMSISRFNAVLGDTYGRPREGDLIFFPLSNNLFEIKYVNKDSIFYQVGQLSVYECKIELFDYTHQEFDTGIPEIDAIEENNTYVVNYTVRGGPGIDFVEDEYVYQGSTLETSTASGVVVSWNSSTKLLVLKNITGVFITGLVINGNTSGANCELFTFDDSEMPNEELSDNKELRDEAIEIEVFNTGNPFGET